MVVLPAPNVPLSQMIMTRTLPSTMPAHRQDSSHSGRSARAQRALYAANPVNAHVATRGGVCDSQGEPARHAIVLLVKSLVVDGKGCPGRRWIALSGRPPSMATLDLDVLHADGRHGQRLVGDALRCEEV